MSKRRRQGKRRPPRVPGPQQGKRQVERKTGPSPSKIRRVLQKREEIRQLMIRIRHQWAQDPDIDLGAVLDRLAENYGKEHVTAVMSLEPERRREIIGQDAFVYRGYRRSFARFGGQRPFHDQPTHEALSQEYLQLVLPRQFQMEGSSKPGASRRLDQLQQEMMVQYHLIEDLLVEDPPPAPAGWRAPEAGEYPEPSRALLTLGPDLEAGERWIEEALADGAADWPAAAADLARMAADPGLLQGWPGDPASWAPYHALGLLGGLGEAAVDQARPLLAVLDLPEAQDWISDRLFEAALAPMGAAVVPILWELAEDADRSAQVRGLAYLSLERAVAQQEDEAAASALADRLDAYLSSAEAEDSEINAYVARVYLESEILDRERALSAAAAAMEAGLLDERIVSRERLERNVEGEAPDQPEDAGAEAADPGAG